MFFVCFCLCACLLIDIIYILFGFQQGEVERVCDYTLHVVSDDGDGMIETLSLKNDETLEDEGNTYTLSANKYYYSVYFDIETSAGSIVIHQDNFSKEIKYFICMTCIILVKSCFMADYSKFNFLLNVIITATFDLQNTSAVEEDNMISVSGTFITDSLARGCFIVIQCNEDTADIFVAIERKGTDQIVNESIPVPPSSYIVYAYDLEENTLPHRIPAYSPSPEIIINTPCKSLECILISFTYQISQILNPTQLQNS